MVDFEWDENKNNANYEKHGVWFEEAAQVFKDPNIRFFFDDDHSRDEDRYIAIGFSGDGKILVVAHCYREASEVLRIISARKATAKERKFYEKGI